MAKNVLLTLHGRRAVYFILHRKSYNAVHLHVIIVIAKVLLLNHVIIVIAKVLLLNHVIIVITKVILLNHVIIVITKVFLFHIYVTVTDVGYHF